MEGAATRKTIDTYYGFYKAGCSGCLGHGRCAMGKVPTHLGMILAEGGEGAATRKTIDTYYGFYKAGCSGCLGHGQCAMGKVPTHLGMILAEGGEGAAARRRVAKAKVGIRIWSILSVLSLDRSEEHTSELQSLRHLVC